MRIIKLSSSEFTDLERVSSFFDHDLRAREPEGKFRFPEGWIAEDGLKPGERVLFSYDTVICYAGWSLTGRSLNQDEDRADYPYFFKLDMATLQTAAIPLQQLEDLLQSKGLHDGRLVRSQGWPIIEDRDEVEVLINALLDQAPGA